MATTGASIQSSFCVRAQMPASVFLT